jgi:3-phosphoshikimate 1-carboxyvinyltransferase
VATARFDPAGPLRGLLRAPADKSISHRAAIVAAMGEGETAVEGYLDADDTRATLSAIQGLGAQVEYSDVENADGGKPRHVRNNPPDRLDLRVRGVGLRGAGTAARDIDVGNAGTLLRLLPGWLAGQGSGAWRLDGDESIRRRPVDRVAEPLRQMGARVECREGRLPPLWVHGSGLEGITYRLPVASAQVKSCVLMAGLLADGPTTVVESDPTRDHTERMLNAAGARIATRPAQTPVAVRGRLPGNRITVEPAERLELERVSVPGDFSSAAFPLVAAVVVPGSEVTVTGVGLNPTRIGLLGILNRMGAELEVVEDQPVGGEPRGSVTVRHSSSLRGIRVEGSDIPLAIDELPLVALLGCFAEGRTVVSDAQELRHKESDRIASVADGLGGLGAEIETSEDGFMVEGTGSLRGGSLEAHGDHRLAMFGAVAGLASRDGVEISGFEAAGVSYPRFESDLRSLL